MPVPSRTTSPNITPKRRNTKAQSAIEYLTTYGWAILILTAVLLVIWQMKLLSPGTFATNVCVFPASFGCLGVSLSAATGNLVINLEQAMQTPINVTAVGCNDQGTTTADPMISYTPASKNIYIGIGGNYTFNSIPCWVNGGVWNGVVGTIYTGYVVVSYTNLMTGFSHTAIAKLSQKAT
jgi:hypothetical protein